MEVNVIFLASNSRARICRCSWGRCRTLKMTWWRQTSAWEKCWTESRWSWGRPAPRLRRASTTQKGASAALPSNWYAKKMHKVSSSFCIDQYCCKPQLSFKLFCGLFVLQDGGGASSRVAGGETQAAGARGWAAAEIHSGQRQTAEGSSGPEEGAAAPSSTLSLVVRKWTFCQ